MTKLSTSVILSLALALSASPAAAKRGEERGGQDAARQSAERGDVMKLRDIESRVVPRMGKMEYLGLDDYDSYEQVYRLRFIEGNRVRFVYVDATTGNVTKVR